jgi:uncharacterized OB-fold protein
MATDPSRLPSDGLYHKDFYAWCRRHELRFQRCTGCGTWRHVPRPMCAECQSTEWEWARVAGTGRIHCWTVVHRALNKAFADDVPYAPVIVELDEGPRIPSWVDMPIEALKVGARVEVWFDDVNDDVALPKFKPVP